MAYGYMKHMCCGQPLALASSFSEGGQGERKAPENAFMPERLLNLEGRIGKLSGKSRDVGMGSFFMLALTVPVDLARGGEINCGSLKIHTCLARLWMSPATPGCRILEHSV